MLRINRFLAGCVWLLLLAGCAGSSQSVKTTEVRVYRENTDVVGMSTMRDLCREVREQVKWDPARSSGHKTTETEIYSKSSGPGESEYRREYRESSRYSAAAADRDEMIQLCLEIK
jgi:hypothetical protein